MLKEVINFSGWNWQACSFVFPERLMLEMKATPVSFSTHITDCNMWSSSPSGNFEMKEAYRLARLEAEAIYVMIVLMVSGFGGCLLSPK